MFNRPLTHGNPDSPRWTVKIGGKVRYRPDGTPLPQITTPVFGYKSHISIDRRFGFIRKAAVTSATDSDGRQMRRVIDTANTAGDVWADSAYRSSKNEAWLKAHMLNSRIHRRKPKGKPIPEQIARANAAKSAIRARVEHVFAHQKNRYGLFIRTIGIDRAQAKLTLANLAYNFDRLIFHQRCATTG
jgi:IS5 family transposase